MRCVHCGKEVKDNVVFCIHCDRPTKQEFNHYACEYYDDFSIYNKIKGNFKGFVIGKKVYRQNSGSIKTVVNSKKINKVNKKKGISIQELYNNYTMANSQQNEDKEINMNLDETETYSDSYNQNVYNSDLNTQTTYKEEKSEIPYYSSKKKQKNIITQALIPIAIIAFIGFVTFASVKSEYSYIVTNSECSNVEYDSSEETTLYEFPENPAIDNYFIGYLDNSTLANDEFIIQYLTMMHEDIDYIYLYDKPLYTLEEFQPYISEIEQIEVDHENDPDYRVYNNLIYIKNLWLEFILPIYKNPSYYEHWELDDFLNQFCPEFDVICNYYLDDNSTSDFN